MSSTRRTKDALRKLQEAQAASQQGRRQQKQERQQNLPAVGERRGTRENQQK